MKKVLMGLLTLTSLNAFAGSCECPDLNGIFACTGTSSRDPGGIIKFETKTDAKGRQWLYVNGGKLTNSYCEDSSFNQDLNLDRWGTATISYVKVTEDTAEVRYDHHGKMTDGLSECVRLKQ